MGNDLRGSGANLQVVWYKQQGINRPDVAAETCIDGSESGGGWETVQRDVLLVSPCPKERSAAPMERTGIEVTADRIEELAGGEGVGQHVLWEPSGVRAL